MIKYFRYALFCFSLIIFLFNPFFLTSEKNPFSADQAYTIIKFLSYRDFPSFIYFVKFIIIDFFIYRHQFIIVYFLNPIKSFGLIIIIFTDFDSYFYW
jgi:hypothetical protein